MATSATAAPSWACTILPNAVTMAACLAESLDVCYWHFADDPTASAFVRFWTKADIGRHWG
jgi:hypothetical protein